MADDIKKVKVNFSAAELETAVEQIPQMQAEIAKKVDAVPGKGLSANDYTDTEKEKLSGLENYDDTAITADISGIKKGVYNRGGQATLTTGWWRIAEAPTLSALNAAEITVFRNYNNNPPEMAKFSVFIAGYTANIKVSFALMNAVASARMITKARLVKGTTSQPAYIEIYYSSASKNAVRAQVDPITLSGTNIFVPLETITVGGIPEGYTTDEFDLAGAATVTASAMTIPMSEATKADLFAGLTDDYKEEAKDV